MVSSFTPSPAHFDGCIVNQVYKIDSSYNIRKRLNAGDPRQLLVLFICLIVDLVRD